METCSSRLALEATRVYGFEDARAFLAGQGVEVDAMAREVEGKFISALFVQTSLLRGAARPVAASEARDVVLPIFMPALNEIIKS